MSYSRWGSSCWYIYWSGDDSSDVEEQCLSINPSTDDGGDFTFLQVLQAVEGDDWSMLGLTEIDEKDVLVECCKEWLEDVLSDCDSEYRAAKATMLDRREFWHRAWYSRLSVEEREERNKDCEAAFIAAATSFTNHMLNGKKSFFETVFQPAPEQHTCKEPEDA